MKTRNKLITLLCGLLLLACTGTTHRTTTVERAFYYWKSDPYALDQNELDQLKNLQVEKLYVKFFEVEKDPVFGVAPVAKSSLHLWSYYSESDTLLANTMSLLEIIPTVFIRNEVLLDVSPALLDTLAVNILYLIDKKFKSNISIRRNATYREIQLDCDWTERSKDNYFYLLKSLQAKCSYTISCTLRLYPYKYPQKMDVPPVTKATLMCYNLIAPLANEDKNSIQNNNELKLYLQGAKKYPIHLDIALPLFSWVHVYRNNLFQGVFNWDTGAIRSKSLRQLKPRWYEVEEDIQVDDFYLRPGNRLKIEEVTAEETLRSIDLLKQYLPLDQRTTVTLFHLDPKNTQQYDYETLRSFYDTFAR